MRQRCCLALQIALLILPLSKESFAQQVAPTLNYFPGGTDVVGRPPDLLIYMRGDLFAVLDPMDASIVILGRDGRVIGRSNPLPFVPTEVIESSASIIFLNRPSGERAVLERAADPERLGTLPTATDVFAPAGAPTPALRRRGDRVMDLPRPDRGNRRLRVHSLAGGYLSDAKILTRDSRGRFYVQTAEVVRDSPAVDVRVYVQRFSASGALIDIASVPVAEMDSVPSRYVAVQPSGDVSVLVPTATGIYFQSLVFRPRSRRAQSAPASPPIRTLINATVHQSSRVEPSETLDLAPAAAPPLSPSTRAKIMERAEGYLNINWIMRAGNFSRQGIDNKCSKYEGKYWLRPRRFTQETIGKTFGPMPYHWGGDDTPATFLTKLSQNYLAGNVCTCREPQFDYCTVIDAAGADCSGFISGCWGIPKHGTSNLKEVAMPVDRLAQLRPGDALNKAGSHVRLFVRFKPGPAQVFEVIESTTNIRCEGVCRSEYSADQLVGYQPMRFKGVQD
jgi:hypothetical protein